MRTCVGSDTWMSQEMLCRSALEELAGVLGIPKDESSDSMVKEGGRRWGGGRERREQG